MRLHAIYMAIPSVMALLAIGSAAPANAAVVAFIGTEMNDTPPPAPSPSCAGGQVLVSFSPSTAIVGGTSNFGAFAPTMSHCLTPPPTAYSGGVFGFAFEAGDELFGGYSGHFTPTATAGVVNTFVDFVVTGGTGRFLGASGTISGVGILDRTAPRPLNNLALSGTLDLPAVPEPQTWAMMISGLGLVGLAARRRRAERLQAA